MAEDTPLYLVRHGRTALNSEPGKVETLRGMLDVPLTREGRKAARAVGRHFKGEGEDVRFIGHTGRKRSIDTANEIGDVLGIEPQRVPGLHSLNLGGLQGKKLTGEVKKQLTHMMQHPEEVPSGGESYGDWLREFCETLTKGLDKYKAWKSGCALWVCHGKNCYAARYLLGDGNKIQITGPPMPGSVLAIRRDGSTKISFVPDDEEHTEAAYVTLPDIKGIDRPIMGGKT